MHARGRSFPHRVDHLVTANPRRQTGLPAGHQERADLAACQQPHACRRPRPCQASLAAACIVERLTSVIRSGLRARSTLEAAVADPCRRTEGWEIDSRPVARDTGIAVCGTSQLSRRFSASSSTWGRRSAPIEFVAGILHARVSRRGLLTNRRIMTSGLPIAAPAGHLADEASIAIGGYREVAAVLERATGTAGLLLPGWMYGTGGAGHGSRMAG
jgi:hypothetical protein